MAFVFGEAISTAAPPGVFADSANTLSTPTAFWGDFSAPHPTNVWWQNLVLGSSTSSINAQPYKVAALTTGLRVTYPKVAYNTMTVNAGGQNITTSSLNNMSLFFTEALSARNVVAYDDLTVTERFTVSENTTYMDAYLAKGSPYVTVKYTGLTPRITTQHSITNVNGTTSFPADITANKFKVTLNNGQTWLLYFDASVTLTVSNSGGWQMVAGSTFTGVARLAIRESAADETLLDTYRSAYATAGTVDVTVAGNQATTTFTWTKAGTGSLLMLALPHHQDILTGSLTDTGFTSLKGPMKAVVGSSWTMQDSLTTITWNAPRQIDGDKLAAVQTAFDADQSYTPSNTSSSYTGGKEIAKAARLIMVGDALADTAGVNTLLDNLKPVSQGWLNATNGNPLKYDTTWGGLCTTNGLASSSADFGNGLYNDHHFHWGYHIYAAAIIAHMDNTWAASYTDKVNTMIRDIMNPSTSDTYFPRFRMIDWYDGHSWAHGLAESSDGKDQESFSEAISAWYGVALWGLAIGDENIYEHGRILLAMEIRALKRYMQIMTGNSIYPSPFSNNKMVGIMFASKVDNTTFFGNNLEFINEINVIPVLPVTEDYISPAYAEDVDALSQQMLDRSVTLSVTRSGGVITAINITSASANNKGFGTRAPTVTISGGGGSGATATAVLTNGELTSITVTNGGSGYVSNPTVTLSANVVTDAWRGFIIAKRAVFDKEQAWTDAAVLSAYDGGQSKSNLLYWIATRGGTNSRSTGKLSITGVG